MPQWIVYALKHPHTNEVRYIGWTVLKADLRLASHIKESRRFQRTRKQRWIYSLVAIGLLPVIEVLDSGVGDGWAESERRWIAFYCDKSSALLNATQGGDGAPGQGTPESRNAAAIKREAAKSPEMRRSIAERAAARHTHETFVALGKSRWLKMTPAERSADAKARAGKKTPEQRSAVAIKREELKRMARQSAPSAACAASCADWADWF